jgi:glycyl-tRNA synthetase beta chain
MRWADLDTAFGRPVQWLVGLHGDAVVPFSFAGHTAGRLTHGHRFLTSDGPFELGTADAYVAAMHDAKVLVDTDARRALLLQGLLDVAAEEGGTLKRDAFLEGEVLGLVERPHVICGRFEERFLKLPAPSSRA